MKALQLYEWRIEFSEFINIPNSISGVVVREIPGEEPLLIPVMNKEILSMDFQNGIISTNDGINFLLAGPGKKIISQVFLNFNEFQESITSPQIYG